MKIIFDVFFLEFNFWVRGKRRLFKEQIYMKVKKKKEKQYFETDSFPPCICACRLIGVFPDGLNRFRKRIKDAVTSKGIQVGTECK